MIAFLVNRVKGQNYKESEINKKRLKNSLYLAIFYFLIDLCANLISLCG